jgi:hypothetical protein
MDTTVTQSHRRRRGPAWVARAMASVDGERVP